MTWLLVALAAVLALDAVRMRRRIGGLAVLADAAPAPDDHVVITVEGVDLAPATRAAAGAHMRAHELGVLDLVPRDLPAVRAMSLVQLVDPRTYRRDRLGAGRTAGHAMLIRADVAARAGVAAGPRDPVVFAQLARRLKHFATTDFAIAPAERARRDDPARRLEVIRATLGPGTTVALAAMVTVCALLALGVALRPGPGLLALAIWQLQPAIALAGTVLRPRDLPLIVVLRAPLEVTLLARTLFGQRDTAAAAARRGHYAERSAGELYEPRRTSCPICAGAHLEPHLRSPDLFQRKPGTFLLDRCTSCGHIFQNPQLSIAGLDYYYADFYDGLGEEGMEAIFGLQAEPYRARARMVRAVATPRRWLDVGAGHGHFCAVARDELPDTRFDGLDLGASIDEAARRGWIDTAYRGLFPELAPTVAGCYDAISMSHYLEHTRDPRQELAAAHTALAANGCLMIEVPDPEFRLARVLRRYWLPWFQPQHLHLLSAKNLERLLRERGFTPVAWHRGQAHQACDFFFAAYLVLNQLAPPARLPWRWRGRAAIAWRTVIWTLGAPLLLAGLVIDNLARPFVARARRSNTYRVLATKAA